MEKFEPNSAYPVADDPATGRPGRTAYSQVCAKYPDDPKLPSDEECRLGTLVEARRGYPVAFAGPRELVARMQKSYSDGMGAVTVVLHDLDLDDFLGSCHGREMSALVRAIATTKPLPHT